MLAPTPNDVLSGRGSSVNNHPGNESFRRMLELHMVRATTYSLPSLQMMMNFNHELCRLISFPSPHLFKQFILLCPSHLIITKAAYSAGTKKQKMMISRTIVDDIYSKEPPGRFLKECPDTGQWIELSRREAADKAAQAMAYAVRNANSPKSSSKKKRKTPSSPSTTTAATATSKQQEEGTVKLKSSSTQRTEQPLPSHANVGYSGGPVAAMSASSAITASTNNPPPPSISSLQQQIPSLPLQQSSTSLPAISSVTSQNELLTQLLLVTQQQQQQIQQQQHALSQLLASLTAPALPISAPLSSLISAPITSSSAQGGASFTLPNTSNIKNDIFRQIIDAAQQDNIGTGLQPASLTEQSQANLPLANPSNQSFIFGAATNPTPLTAAQQQHELDNQVYHTSMVENQFNQSLLMPSPPNSLSSNTALSFQQQSQQSQPLRQNHASASIRSYPPHPPQAAKNDEESI